MNIEEELVLKPQDSKLDKTGRSSRFDIAGYCDSGNLKLIIENKFNACITEKDINYLNHFHDKNCILMFIVSHSDTQTSWSTIKSLLSTNKISIIAENIDNCFALKVRSSIILLTSWKHLLEQISKNTEIPERDQALEDTASIEEDYSELDSRRNQMSDINQLSRLCEEQDKVSFIEFNDEKTTVDIPRRVLNILDIMDSVCELLDNEVESIGISKYGYKLKSSRGSTCREMAINIYNYCRLTFDFKLWHESKNNNPLCLQIQDRTVKGTPSPYTDQQKQNILTKFKGIAFTDRDWIYVPLTIKRNSKYHEVVQDLKDQIIQIANILPKKH